MTATELMIGDWLFITDASTNLDSKIGMYGKVVELRTEGNYQALKLCLGKPYDTYFIEKTEEYQPIPLTYEFLRKVFPNTNDGVYWYGRKGKYEVTMVHEENRIKVLIEYVHELQHALRLCGIEKEIEL